MKKTVYLFDESGRSAGEYKAQESPLEPGVFLTPQRSTDIAPPSTSVSQYAQFNGASWTLLDIPIKPPYVPTQEELDAAAAQQAAQDAKAAVKADNTTQFLISHSPSEIKDWVQGKLPSLPQNESAFIARLAVAIGALYR